jgi:hypothetical protein
MSSLFFSMRTLCLHPIFITKSNRKKKERKNKLFLLGMLLREKWRKKNRKTEILSDRNEKESEERCKRL